VLAWVIGAGGLLGSSVRTALGARVSRFALWADEGPIPWDDEAALGPALQSRTSCFLAEAVARGQDGWAVLWCGGASVVASGPREVAADLSAWERFLGALDHGLEAGPRVKAPPGHVLLASSAGGVWAGHVGAAITESTPACPISDYGFGHLAREKALAAFGLKRPAVRTAAVRLSNLYGPGQRLDKRQGLVSQIARSLILRRPIHVYVPLDTVRDYLFAADAGQGMADVLERLARAPDVGSRPLLKILASEQETSIAALLATFRQVTRRRVAVVAGLSPVGQRQPLRLRFRSEVWTSVGRGHRTPLPEGVARVYHHLLREFGRGTLSVAAASLR
jgi:UDP-glucose 4-epimerase